MFRAPFGRSACWGASATRDDGHGVQDLPPCALAYAADLSFLYVPRPWFASAGEGLRTIELSLDDLKTKFKRHTVSATLQCTGNRRHEINEVRPVQVRCGHE